MGTTGRPARPRRDGDTEGTLRSQETPTVICRLALPCHRLRCAFGSPRGLCQRSGPEPRGGRSRRTRSCPSRAGWAPKTRPGEAGGSHRPGGRLRKGDVTVARRGARPPRVPVGAGGPRSAKVDRIPAANILIGATHTNSVPDCYAFPDGKGGHTGDLEVHGPRLRESRGGAQRGDRPPPAGPDQGGNGRGEGEDRVQLLRARPVRPADECHPGGQPVCSA